ncbi:MULTISPECIES: ATP-binding protein [unclassified Lysinibacillus]|uniref:ATP-binding protein n=1 Tax=unclassified Lysinibacillus TaxID=2636778 RepID=UPI0030F7E616
MKFTLRVQANRQAVHFIDNVMENYTNIYSIPFSKELRFVLHELVINAIEAMEKIDTPSSYGKIQIQVLQNDEEITLTVIDEAQGITENDLKKALQFDPNEHYYNYTDRGRGLFFVKNMVDSIWFKHISRTKFLVGVSKKIHE